MSEPNISLVRVRNFYHAHSKANQSQSKLNLFSYAYIYGRLVELISPAEIDRFLSRKYFSEQVIELKTMADESDFVELNFKNTDSRAEYLVFENTALKITEESMEYVSVHDLPFYVLKSLKSSTRYVSQVIDHAFTLCQSPIEIDHKHGNLIFNNDPAFIYNEFLIDLASLYWEDGQSLSNQQIKEQNTTLVQLMLTIGYLASQYKSKDFNPVTFIMDNHINEDGFSGGRSGKSTFVHGLSFVRPTIYLSGRHLINDQYLYRYLTEFDNCIHIDDLNTNAELRNLSDFSDDTFYIQHQDCMYSLNFEQLGKLIISANWNAYDETDDYQANICRVSDYYHEASDSNDFFENRTPISKFGKMLYNGFTAEEWNKFYNLVAYCIQLHLIFERKTLII